MYVRGCQKFGIKEYWRLQFLGYLRTLSLTFQKTRTKIEFVLTLPCLLSHLNWDSQQGRVKTTLILVGAFWNFKLKVLKYPKNCSLQYILIPNFWHPYSTYLKLDHTYYHSKYSCNMGYRVSIIGRRGSDGSGLLSINNSSFFTFISLI